MSQVADFQTACPSRKYASPREISVSRPRVGFTPVRGCGTELATFHPNFGLSCERRWETSPRENPRCFRRTLKGNQAQEDPSVSELATALVTPRTQPVSNASKSSKRHGGKGCSDAIRLRKGKIFEGYEPASRGRGGYPKGKSQRTGNAMNPRIGIGMQQARSRQGGGNR